MRIVVAALLALAPGIALAQNSPPLSLDEAVAQALKKNPRLSAAARDIVAAQQGVRSARALTNPELVFTPAIIRGGSDEELLFRQPLEINGTRSARTSVASARLRQTQAQATVELRSLVFDTKTAYFRLAQAQELRALAAELLRTAEEFDRVTRRQVEIGTRPGLDQTRTGIEVARARQQVTQAEGEVRVAQGALNTLMARDPAELIGPLSPLPSTSTPVDRDESIRQALTARAEIQVDEAAAEALRQEARLVRNQGRPDVAFQARAEQVTRGVENAGIGVGINLPILDYGSRRHRIRELEESARAQADRVTAQRNQVRQEVDQALARLRAAEEAVQNYPQGILEQTRRLVEATRTGFQAGASSILDLLEAQRTLRSVQTEYTNALAARAQAQAELERAIGGVPATLMPGPNPQPRKAP